MCSLDAMMAEIVTADVDDWLYLEEPEFVQVPATYHDVTSLHPVEYHLHSQKVRENLIAFQLYMDGFCESVFELYADCSESVSLDGIRLLDDGEYIEMDLYIAVIILDALLAGPLQIYDVVPLPARDDSECEWIQWVLFFFAESYSAHISTAGAGGV